jgi:hypothetical protein
MLETITPARREQLGGNVSYEFRSRSRAGARLKLGVAIGSVYGSGLTWLPSFSRQDQPSSGRPRDRGWRIDRMGDARLPVTCGGSGRNRRRQYHDDGTFRSIVFGLVNAGQTLLTA